MVPLKGLHFLQQTMNIVVDGPKFIIQTLAITQKGVGRGKGKGRSTRSPYIQGGPDVTPQDTKAT